MTRRIIFGLTVLLLIVLALAGVAANPGCHGCVAP